MGHVAAGQCSFAEKYGTCKDDGFQEVPSCANKNQRYVVNEDDQRRTGSVRDSSP